MPRKFIKSFKYAQEGMVHTLRTQRNVWIHILFGVLVVAAAYGLKVTQVELALLVLTITVVITVEILNTAIEETINLVKPELHPLAGLIKNLAAAAVLVAALGSIIIGCLIFLPRLVP